MKYILTIFLTIFMHYTNAQDDAAVRQKHFNVEKNVAMDGYDPVSYFGTKLMKGKSTFQYNYKGIVYYFSSQANLDIFKSNPAKYEPAYGGWCAYAMGNAGEKVEVDPETFKIINGKLYLFYNKFFNNTLEDWNKDEINLKKKAEANWTKIIK